MIETPAPFDRVAVRAHRARTARLGADSDFLFDEVAVRLLDRLDDIRRPFTRVLDLGCRRGGLGARLATRTTEGGTVVQCDLAPEMAGLARDADGLATVAGDEEALPFAPGSFDLIVSNLTLHWTNDLPGALVQVRRALAPDGLFLAALFGVGTLAELRDALMAAELDAEGGVSPRVSPFAEVRDGGDLLARAGFALPVADLDTLHISFESALHLMRDLRRMGEANSVAERRKGFSRRRTLMNAAARYPVDADGRITATFEIIFLAGWAPGPDQPRALRPGTATARLADHLGTQETPAGDSTGRTQKT
ncbi:MAG: methyltransferase domain-containing protein [Alphaproteobacteria bacterium]